MPNKLVFVTNKNDLSDAIKLSRISKKFTFASGSKSIDGILRESKIRTVNPDEFMSEYSQKKSLSNIVNSLESIEKNLKEFGYSESARSLVAVQLIMALSIHERMSSASEYTSDEIAVLVNERAIALPEYFGAESRSSADLPGSNKEQIGFLPFLPIVNPFSKPYLLEMRARKARTRPAPGMPRFVRLVPRRDKSDLRSTQKNLRILIRDLLRPGKLSQFVLSSAKPVMDPQVVAGLTQIEYAVNETGLPSHRVAQLVSTILAEYTGYKQLLERFIARFGTNLSAAAFDSPVIPFQVALAETASEAGIPVTQESHGCIVVHGGGDREQAASILAGGGYNWIPSIKNIIPRSPMQAIGAPRTSDIRMINRVVPLSSIGERSKGQPLSILYAPNFLRWHMSIPAVTSTCFETYDIANHLAEIVRRRRDWRLNIRIKVTVSDVPEKRELDGDRGLLPKDIKDLVSIAPNVHDCSAQSYAENLREADLVISEGLTAVMVEALEHRIPVLLINRSRNRTPSLPSSWSFVDANRTNQRNSVYSASLSDDIEKFIDLISDRHVGKPLNDEELCSRCWSESNDSDQNYLIKYL